MENTSKALLIAAAVLIVILIISISLKVYTSIKSTPDTTDKIGKAIDRASDDATLVIDGYKVFRNSDKAVNNPNNKYYTEYSTGIKLQPDYVYTVSLDYEVLENKNNSQLGCGIGFNDPEIGSTTYNKDIVWWVNYSDYSEGAKGKFKFSFKLNDYPNALNAYNEYIKKGEVKISLRPARSRIPSEFVVGCSNIRIIYK